MLFRSSNLNISETVLLQENFRCEQHRMRLGRFSFIEFDVHLKFEWNQWIEKKNISL